MASRKNWYLRQLRLLVCLVALLILPSVGVTGGASFPPPFTKISPVSVMGALFDTTGTSEKPNLVLEDSLVSRTGGRDFLVALVKRVECDYESLSVAEQYSCTNPEALGVFRLKEGELVVEMSAVVCSYPMSSSKIQLYDIMSLPEEMRILHRENQVVVLDAKTALFGYRCAKGYRDEWDESLTLYGLVDDRVVNVFERSLGWGTREGNTSVVQLRLVAHSDKYNELEVEERINEPSGKEATKKERYRYDGRKIVKAQ